MQCPSVPHCCALAGTAVRHRDARARSGDAAGMPSRSTVQAVARRVTLGAVSFPSTDQTASVKRSGASLAIGNGSQLIRRNRARSQRVSATAVVRDIDAARIPPGRTVLNNLDAFWRFTRPHTIYGTLLSVVSVSMLALNGVADVTAATAWGLVQAIVPALLMNVCIVGFNQISDIEIDKINKPYLPLASGEFSVGTGWALVLGTGAVALAMGLATGSVPLQLTLAGSLALGIVYSADAPFLRWKRFPLLAAGCILAVRAMAVQFGFYLHMRAAVLGRGTDLGAPVIMAAAFMCLFSVVIAFFKDIPDVKGDRVSAIQTMSVRYGERTIFNVCIGLLLAAYAGAGAVGLLSDVLWCKALLVAAHGGMALALWRRAQTVDTASHSSLTGFYMFIWKLFYLEYLVLPAFGLIH